MADSEFEEFRKTLDPFPSHLKTTASPFYTLVPDLSEDDYPSSKSDSSDQEDEQLARHPLHSLSSASPSHHRHQQQQKQQQHVHADLASTPSTTSASSSASATAISSPAAHAPSATAPVSKSSDEDDDIGDGLRTAVGVIGLGSGTAIVSHAVHLDRSAGSMATVGIAGGGGHQVERRRRKLPEIPKNRKSFISQYTVTNNGSGSLAEELAGSASGAQHTHTHIASVSGAPTRSMLAMKCGYLLDEDSSPDSERLTSLGDVDSGHSTAHSPTDFKSMSPPPPLPTAPLPAAKRPAGAISVGTSPTSPSLLHRNGASNSNSDADEADADADVDDATTADMAPFQPPPFGGIPYSQIEMLEATHRGLHKFIPRHRDEIEVEIGDSVYVQREADDLWCEGVNLRTGRQGIFPSAYAVDLDYNDFDPTAPKVKRERYLLGYLGSVETLAHKGTGVVCQAVRKIVGEFGESPAGQLCILEISDQGLRMVDRSSKSKKEPRKPCIDYFYSLKNVSFCAFHPRDHRYIGFITKHPTIQRFACHVFKGHESTRPVAEAVGRAFQHFYQKFIETAYPIEDIYIE